MGLDLYYRKTPKTAQGKSLTMTFWCIIADRLGFEEKEDLFDVEFTDSDIPMLTSLSDEHPQINEDVNELIKAIHKHKSITLYIDG